MFIFYHNYFQVSQVRFVESYLLISEFVEATVIGLSLVRGSLLTTSTPVGCLFELEDLLVNLSVLPSFWANFSLIFSFILLIS